MSSIMTVRAPTGLQEILSSQAKSLGLARNALILQILWEWTKSQGFNLENENADHPSGA